MIFKIVVTCFAFSAALNCPFPAIPRNGFVIERSMKPSCSRDALETDEKVRFGCDEAWNATFVDTVECMEDGSLKGVPRCLKQITQWQMEFYDNETLSRVQNHSEHIPCNWRTNRIILRPETNVPDVVEVRLGACRSGALRGTRVNVNNVMNCSVAIHYVDEMIFVCDDFDIGPLEFLSITTTESSLSIESISILTESGDYCGEPPLPINGGFAITESGYQYNCGNNFILSGSSKAECDPATGQWDSVPICEQDLCQPPVVEKGRLERISNGTFRCQCDKYFTLRGNEIVTCDPASRKWSHIPTCESDRCRDPPLSINSRVELISPGRYHYECDLYFTLRGNKTVQCDPSTGQWSSIPNCQRECTKWPIHLTAPAVGMLIILSVFYFLLWKSLLEGQANSLEQTRLMATEPNSEPVDLPPSPVHLIPFPIPE